MLLQQLLYDSELLVTVDLAEITSPLSRGKRFMIVHLFPSKGDNSEVIVLHCHIAVWAAVSKRAPLLLEGDEVPNSHHCVFRHTEVEQLHTGEGVESI